MRTMKIEARFTSKQNRLYTVSGEEQNVKDCVRVNAKEWLGSGAPSPEARKLLCIEVNWSDIGLDEDSYDEAFLAELRDALKNLEEKNVFAFIKPVCGSASFNAESFTASCKHCARRIKDAASVIGFAIPAEFTAPPDVELFIEELSAKHAHYVFFSQNPEIIALKTEIVQF